MTTTGVLVMAYGTPSGPDDIEAYYTHIRRGRPPTDEQLASLVHRYDALGGVSPMAARTEAQAAAIDAALTRLRPDACTVLVGQKHAAPFIEDSAGALARAGVGTIVGLVLAPHYSKGSVGEYHERARSVLAPLGVAYRPIDSWHLLPSYLGFLTTQVREQRASLPDRHKVIFTAHSLPERLLTDDPYADQLLESATAVADAVGMLRWPDWALGWQSAGRTPEPWRGPDILEIIRELGATGRADGVLVCPQGFTADHLEVLYDLDIEAAKVAADAGLAFARTRSLNDDTAVMAELATLVLAMTQVPSTTDPPIPPIP